MSAQDFQRFLREHQAGSTLQTLSDALQDLVAAVTEEGRAGKLTFTISMKPIGKGEGLEVGCDVKLAPPKPTVGVSIFYATPENSLVRNDPRQETMELREIGPKVPRNLA